jgi:choline kinase
LSTKKKISDYTDDLNSPKKRIINELKKSQNNSYSVMELPRYGSFSLRGLPIKNGNHFYHYEAIEVRIKDDEKTIKKRKLVTDDKEEFHKMLDELLHG